jgi:peroxiredoxin
LRALGTKVFGLSTQGTGYQRETVERLHLPFELLSDESLAFTKALGLLTFEFEEMVLIKWLTLVIRDGHIERVFYPVFSARQECAEEVVEWLSQATL